jgi:hypothetical protein
MNTKTTTPRSVALLRNGTKTVDQLTNSQLDEAVEWANNNDPFLAVELDDEVDFRLAPEKW